MSKTDDITLLREEVASLQSRLVALEEMLAEDIYDRSAYDRVRHGEAFPASLFERIEGGGEHPVKVLREYRGFTQKELSGLVGTTPGYLSQVETRQRAAGRHLTARLAEALSVSLDMLSMDDG